MVYDGVPLREVADVLGLPWWLRKLPPRAFAAPLPKFPLDQDFTFRISNLIPRDEHFLPIWLTHVGHACEASGPAYALWVARQTELTDPVGDMFRLMAAWAWFSQRDELPGHRLLRRPWSVGHELQAGARGTGRMAATAASGRVPGTRHREPVACRRHRPWLPVRGAAHGRRLHRRERGARQLPRPVCRPAARRAHRRILDPQERTAHGLRRDRPARRGRDHAGHRAAARHAQPPGAAGGVAGHLRLDGQPGPAAAVTRAACSEADPPGGGAPQAVGSLPGISRRHAA